MRRRIEDSLWPRSGRLLVRLWAAKCGLPIALLACLGAGVLVTGCGREPTGDLAETPVAIGLEAGTTPPNVVIFLIDTLRADRLTIYGNDRPVSPRFEALAKEAIVFDRAYAPAPWTLPSVASMMLSQPICEHGVLVDGQRIVDTARPLAERLRDLGYRTGSYHANPYAGAMTGLDRGFDTVALDDDSILDREWMDRWLGPDPPVPFFLYLHTIEPHEVVYALPEHLILFGSPYTSRAERHELRDRLTRLRKLSRWDFVRNQPFGTTPTSEEQAEHLAWLDERAERYGELYDAQVFAADEHLGDVIDSLVERGVWDNTLFIVVSDHGEEMGEHGGWLHDQAVYQELVHVPLLIKLPGGARGGERIATTASLLDLMPTILEVVGADTASPGAAGQAEGGSGGDERSPIRGRDLLEPIDPANADAGRVVSLRINRKKYFEPNKLERGDLNVVVVDGEMKAIYNVEVDRLELFDLAVDPDEQVDLAAERPAEASTYRRAAREFLRQCRAQAEAPPPDLDGLDPQQLEALRSLGYIGGEGT